MRVAKGYMLYISPAAPARARGAARRRAARRARRARHRHGGCRRASAVPPSRRRAWCWELGASHAIMPCSGHIASFVSF